MKRFVCACVLVGLAAIAGCGGDGASGVTVSGTVTLDNAPLETGMITFLPSDGKGASAGATITNGKYRTKIEPGPKKVSIISEKVIGQTPRDPADPTGEQITQTQQIIPPQYNDQTTLTLDVPAGGKNDADFTLTSK
jgi:hypothetical protein